MCCAFIIFLCYCSTMTQLLREYASKRALYLMNNPNNENEYWVLADEIPVWLEANIFQTKETGKRRVGIQQDNDFFHKIGLLSQNADIQDFGKVTCLTDQGGLSWNQIQKWIRYTTQKTQVRIMGWFIDGIHFAVWYSSNQGFIHWEPTPEIWLRKNLYEQYYDVLHNKKSNNAISIQSSLLEQQQIRRREQIAEIIKQEIEPPIIVEEEPQFIVEEEPIVKKKREVTRLEWIKLGCPPNCKIIVPTKTPEIQIEEPETVAKVVETIITSWEDVTYHDTYSQECKKWWTFAQWGRTGNEYFQNNITRVGAD